MSFGSISDTIKLSNGVQIPMLGLGTYLTPEGSVVEQSILWALELGYRHIDTAALYYNERGVGNAVRRSGVPREQIFVTTKVWNDDIRKGYDGVLKAFDQSLKLLGMDYVDLYLLHWPIKGHDHEAWRAMEKIYGDGRAKSIGVSNYLVHHLRELLPATKIKPMVNQVEFHPRVLQRDLLDFCKQQNIILEAWGPLMQGKAFDIQELADIGKRHNKSIAQILLRWDLQHGVVTIPKSVKRERIVENAGLYDFELSKDEMARIDALDQNKRVGANPNNFNF